jgi:hypothetical protein
MTSFRILVLFTACAAIVAGKSRADIPLAPLPGKVMTAKKVFLLNGGGNDLGYDTVYAAFRQWPRFTVVDSASSADIVMEIREMPEEILVAARGNNHPIRHEIVLTIFDPASKEPLWSSSERVRIALTAKNRDKETINAAEKLIGDLKARAGVQ